MIDLSIVEAFVLSMGAIGFGSMLLVKGGDWMVDSSVFVAKRFGVSPLIIGFTILAFGTSMPELLVSAIANLKGSPGIAVGNVLGSNVANIALVLSMGALFAPIVTRSKALMRDIVFMLMVSVGFVYLLIGDFLNRPVGVVMIVLLLVYVAYQYYMSKRNPDALAEEDEEAPAYKNMAMALLFLGMGMGAIAIGAEFLVRGARIGAGAIGVPESVIAISLIAFGTSLPELSTSIIAARKGHADMMLGNIVGSNVFNILMIMGITTLIKPIHNADFAAQVVDLDVWVMLSVCAIFAGLILLTKKMGRLAAIVFFSAYVLYNISIYAIYVAP